MSAPKDGGPAFPREDYQTDDAPGQRGMSLRDWFAGQGIIAAGLTLKPPPDATLELACQQVAEASYALADAMLAERERQK